MPTQPSVAPIRAPHPLPGTARDLAIDAVDLAKTYGRGERSVRALAGVSFAVPAGTVFGLLGPNGAGKSTTVKILTTLTRADSGRALVNGIDVVAHPDRVRRAIGYVSQRPCFDPVGTGRENLVLQGRTYGMPRREARARADELLARFGLADAAGRRAGRWSGGMQRKLDVAMGLVHRPRVLFLDEPTTGLDPQARADMWTEIADLTRTEGVTVLLTTHYLEEADRLADDLVIVDRGAVVAAGTPEELKSGLAGDTIQVELAQPDPDGHARGLIGSIAGVREAALDGATLRARVADGAATLTAVLAVLDNAGVALTSVTVARPSLDDVYLRHAGRAFRADDTRDERGTERDSGDHADHADQGGRA